MLPTGGLSGRRSGCSFPTSAHTPEANRCQGVEAIRGALTGFEPHLVAVLPSARAYCRPLLALWGEHRSAIARGLADGTDWGRLGAVAGYCRQLGWGSRRPSAWGLLMMM